MLKHVQQRIDVDDIVRRRAEYTSCEVRVAMRGKLRICVDIVVQGHGERRNVERWMEDVEEQPACYISMEMIIQRKCRRTVPAVSALLPISRPSESARSLEVLGIRDCSIRDQEPRRTEV